MTILPERGAGPLGKEAAGRCLLIGVIVPVSQSIFWPPPGDSGGHRRVLAYLQNP